MSVFALDDSLYFPPVNLADPDGLIALGGDLSPERLLLAYRSGIFPWFDSPPVLWWSPDPRFVLFPAEFRRSKSLKSTLRKNTFEFTVNKAFDQVIGYCQKVPRSGQDGTWITDDMKSAYLELHRLGFAYSAEVWNQGRLVGGLYGVKIGKVFFGESMFSLESQASRIAMANYMDELQDEGIQLIDCQVYSDYLESMGARMIPRESFLKFLVQD
jgi:leucyl/phenylalanyl-tRNA--protein transferase